MFFQLKLQEIVNFTEMHSSFIWAARVKEETQNSGSEKPLFHAQVQATGTGCHCVYWAHSQAGALREELELWFQVGGSIMYSLYQERGQSSHGHLLLSWVQRGKDRRVLERDSFFKNTVYLFLCACMWEAVGVQCMSEARKGHPICWRWSYRRLLSAPCEWQELNLSSL